MNRMYSNGVGYREGTCKKHGRVMKVKGQLERHVGNNVKELIVPVVKNMTGELSIV